MNLKKNLLLYLRPEGVLTVELLNVILYVSSAESKCSSSRDLALATYYIRNCSNMTYNKNNSNYEIQISLKNLNIYYILITTKTKTLSNHPTGYFIVHFIGRC